MMTVLLSPFVDGDDGQSIEEVFREAWVLPIESVDSRRGEYFCRIARFKDV